MPTSQESLRQVSYDRYLKAHDNTQGRVTMDELESGLIVEAYTTNDFFRDSYNMAINFTAEIEVINRTIQNGLGYIGIKFYIISGSSLSRLPNADRRAAVRPEPHMDGSVTEWAIMDIAPLAYRSSNHKLKYGLFTHWVDDDASEVLEQTEGDSV